ncbi:MAG: helix-turn-helix domain-containing protein [Bacteroidota bacterium]|nr:helix-turn-helix domain-containing protein [Bacteroidota bacterium]
MKTQNIIQFTAEYFNVAEKAIKRKTRKKEIVEARHIAMWFMKKHTKLTLENIGKKFNKDHSSVSHASKKIDNMMSVYVQFHSKILNFEKTALKKFNIAKRFNFSFVGPKIQYDILEDSCSEQLPEAELVLLSRSKDEKGIITSNYSVVDETTIIFKVGEFISHAQTY